MSERDDRNETHNRTLRKRHTTAMVWTHGKDEWWKVAKESDVPEDGWKKAMRKTKNNFV